MNWQLFPIFLIKAIFGAAVSVGLVGSLLTGFFIAVGHVSHEFGPYWATFAFVAGVVFAICTIVFTLVQIDAHTAKQKAKQ